MGNVKEVSAFFDALLSAPGMNEKVKLDMRLSRRDVLLLVSVLSNGANRSNSSEELVAMFNEACVEVAGRVESEMLEKSGLTDLSERMRAISKGVKGS